MEHNILWKNDHQSWIPIGQIKQNKLHHPSRVNTEVTHSYLMSSEEDNGVIEQNFHTGHGLLTGTCDPGFL